MRSKFPKEWEKIKLGDIAKIISGGTPKRKEESFWGGKIPWISIKDFPDNEKYIKVTEEKITEKGLENSSTNILESSDIIISARGTVGNLAIVKFPMTFNQSCYGLRGKKSTLNNNYFYYFLKYDIERLKRQGHGSVFNTIIRSTLKNLVVNIPPLSEQKVIAETLSALDDKIEVNNKTDKNLEKQAQAIFKHWFVDFEFPDENGNSYKFSGGEMVESELGMIPKGWEIKSLKDFLPVLTGKKNANIATDGGEYNFFTCSQEPFLTDVYSFEGKAVLVAGNGDFNVKFYNGKFEAYQRTYVLIPEESSLAGFIYYMVKFNLNKIILNARGSVISYLTKGDLENSTIAFPKKANHTKIIEVLDIINVKILNNQKQNKRLSQLRDTLLPKLMSGEIRVPLD